MGCIRVAVRYTHWAAVQSNIWINTADLLGTSWHRGTRLFCAELTRYPINYIDTVEEINHWNRKHQSLQAQGAKPDASLSFECTSRLLEPRSLQVLAGTLKKYIQPYHVLQSSHWGFHLVVVWPPSWGQCLSEGKRSLAYADHTLEFPPECSSSCDEMSCKKQTQTREYLELSGGLLLEELFWLYFADFFFVSHKSLTHNSSWFPIS